MRARHWLPVFGSPDRQEEPGRTSSPSASSPSTIGCWPVGSRKPSITLLLNLRPRPLLPPVTSWHCADSANPDSPEAGRSQRQGLVDHQQSGRFFFCILVFEPLIKVVSLPVGSQLSFMVCGKQSAKLLLSGLSIAVHSTSDTSVSAQLW